MTSPLETSTGGCCGHPRDQHGQERDFYECDDSRREVCLMCPGYVREDEVTTGYPNGKAWHRFKAAGAPERKA